MAAKLRLAVAEGKDPLAERRAERGRGTFEEVHERYLEQHAKKRNKSWQQANKLVRRFLLPRWGKLDAGSITRADVRQLISGISAPIVANQTLAAASAVFTWAVKMEVVPLNPCVGVERNATHSRERVLSDTEVRGFWHAVDRVGLMRSYALKTILLTGQRPGEVSHMRLDHIADGWWTMPGSPDPRTGWPGTKNSQTLRVWLPVSVQRMISELSDESNLSTMDKSAAGFVFTSSRGKPVAGLSAAMMEVCVALDITEKVTPHDLRRTHGSTITRLGHGRDAMN